MLREFRTLRLVIAFGSVLVGLGVFRPLLSPTPEVRVIGHAVTVNAGGSSGAEFTTTDPTEICASAINYQFESFAVAGGSLTKLGSRAMLTSMPTYLYDRAMASRPRGQCMGACLSGYDANGSIGRLVLVPKDASAMKSMARVDLKAGWHFRLHGSFMQLRRCWIDNQEPSLSLSGAQFFLVDSITRDVD